MSRIFELRTYTLASPEAADAYSIVHWSRHVPSLERLGVTTHGVFREAGAAVVVALVSMPEGADPDAVSREFLASDAFRADMAGFALRDIVGVTTRVLEAAPASPLR